MKKIFFSFILIVLYVSQPLGAQHLLHTDGTAIVNQNQDTIIFRGMGLGGWMVQEGYMMQTASFASPQHKIRDTIEDLIGATNTELFYQKWRENHVRKIDIDSMKSWGFNMIRLPMHYNLYTLPIEDEPVSGQNTWLNTGFEMTDSLLSWCQQNEMYLILDLHAAPGGQGYDQAISDYDPSKPSLWESVANRQKAASLWRKLADRYKNEQWIGGYDLLNEPNWNLPGGAALRAFYDMVTDSIRSVDTTHIIYIEGNWFANTFDGLTPPWDSNLVYSPHKYWSPVFNISDIQYGLDLRDNFNVPIWFGETGENSNAWYTDLIRLFETNGVGWAWWPEKKLETINAPLSYLKNSGYQDLLYYWSGATNTPPTAAVATNSLMQLAENLKLENCVYNRGVIDAMFRQVYSDETLPWTYQTIPGVIYASEYDLGTINNAYYDTESYQLNPPPAWNSGWIYRNDGVDIQENSDTMNNNGYKVGFVDTDDWMQYEVDVQNDSVYDVHVRVTCNGSTGGNFHFEANGVRVSPSYYTPNTGSWTSWGSRVVPNVIMQKEDTKLRMVADGGGFNVSSFEFIPVGPTTNLDYEFVDGYIDIPNRITIQLNKSILPVQGSGANGFVVTSNGVTQTIVGIESDSNQSRLLHIDLASGYKFTDLIKVSFGGNILAKDGTSLQPFTLEIIENLLPSVHLIPGRVEAEDYLNAVGVSLETCQDITGGQNIGYLDPGDYIDYEVLVLNTGMHKADFRTASESAGALDVQVVDSNGTILSTLLSASFPATGGWQNWETYSHNIPLTAGEQILRLYITQSPFNVNWIEFWNGGIQLQENQIDQNIIAYPNPSVDGFITLEMKQQLNIHSLEVKNYLNQVVHSSMLNQEKESINLSYLPKGLYLMEFQSDSGEPIEMIKIQLQ